MLTTGPVWALNLLTTDANRDQLEWESISVSAQYDNGPKNSSPYERFFNRQDFWERSSYVFCQLESIHPRHDNIRKQNMDLPFVIFCKFQCFFSVASRENGIAEGQEKIFEHIMKGNFVFNEQNGFTAMR